VDLQEDFESKKLWLRVSEAVICSDQQMATQEKFLLEEEQRKAARERKLKMADWVPRLFEQNLITGGWVYKYADLRPWDAMNDVVQYERDMIIQTKTRHQTPIVHTTSLVQVDDIARSQRHSASLRKNGVHATAAVQHFLRRDSAGSSSPDDDGMGGETDCNRSLLESHRLVETGAESYENDTTCHMTLRKCLAPLMQQQVENSRQLATLTRHIEVIEREVRASLRAGNGGRWPALNVGQMAILFVIFLFIQLLLLHWLK
jgi:hypothetical protein